MRLPHAWFRQFFDKSTGTLSYLLACRESGQALLIDPVLECLPLYLGVLDELQLKLKLVVDTHIPVDHVTGADLLRKQTGAAVMMGRQSRGLQCDNFLEDGTPLQLGDLQIDVLQTPGHTPGCLTLAWEDRLFTGDCLLIGGWGRTDEPGGNPGSLYDSITRRLLPLPDEILIYPGHDLRGRRVSCIGEERQSNPLFQGLSRDEFVARQSRSERRISIPGSAWPGMRDAHPYPGD